MPIIEFGGEQFEVGNNGHLIDPRKWTTDFLRYYAKEDGIILDVARLIAINLLREKCTIYDNKIGMGRLVKDFHMKIHCLKLLENSNICLKRNICNWKYAGLPLPG
jgi:hypothetical protein